MVEAYHTWIGTCQHFDEVGLDVEKELVVEMLATALSMLENVVGLRAG